MKQVCSPGGEWRGKRGEEYQTQCREDTITYPKVCWCPQCNCEQSHQLLECFLSSCYSAFCSPFTLQAPLQSQPHNKRVCARWEVSTFFLGKVSSLGWPQTLHIAKVDLELSSYSLPLPPECCSGKHYSTIYAILVTESKVSGTLDNALLAGLQPQLVPT